VQILRPDISGTSPFISYLRAYRFVLLYYIATLTPPLILHPTCFRLSARRGARASVHPDVRVQADEFHSPTDCSRLLVAAFVRSSISSFRCLRVAYIGNSSRVQLVCRRNVKHRRMVVRQWLLMGARRKSGCHCDASRSSRPGRAGLRTLTLLTAVACRDATLLWCRYVR